MHSYNYKYTDQEDLDALDRFSAVFYKDDNFCDFLFAFGAHRIPSEKGHTLKMGSPCEFFFSFKVVRKTSFDSVAYLESISVPLKRKGKVLMRNVVEEWLIVITATIVCILLPHLTLLLRNCPKQTVYNQTRSRRMPLLMRSYTVINPEVFGHFNWW